MQKRTSRGAPAGWFAPAHEQWVRGERRQAIGALLAELNRHGCDKPVRQVLQLSHYVYLSGDPAGAAVFLERIRPDHPRDPEVLRNLAACLYKSGQHAAALQRLEELLALHPDDAVALDGLCSVLWRLGRCDEAAVAGTRALVLKDRAAGSPPAGWRLPATSPAEWAAQPGKRDVIAFSLWGANPRYLDGAVDNQRAARNLYPGWLPVYFIDATVPAATCEALSRGGAELRLQPPGQPDRQRLAWRFKVANDPTVGRFLVRDADAVVNARERAAVAEWLASDRWFHVMRDWWTHTDLVLAGMWGGVAGALPDLDALLAGYRSPAVETPNIDQWFLRDCVWRYLRGSSLVHDRCFTPPGARRWPTEPPAGDAHVGQNESALRAQRERQRLQRVGPAA